MSIFSIKKINGFERKSPRRIESPLLRGFLEVERQMFGALDIEPVATLEEARRPYRNDVIWQGPSFDVGATEDVNG